RPSSERLGWIEPTQTPGPIRGGHDGCSARRHDLGRGPWEMWSYARAGARARARAADATQRGPTKSGTTQPRSDQRACSRPPPGRALLLPRPRIRPMLATVFRLRPTAQAPRAQETSGPAWRAPPGPRVGFGPDRAPEAVGALEAARFGAGSSAIR